MKSSNIKLRYGHGEIELTLRNVNVVAILKPLYKKPKYSVKELVHKALGNPIGVSIEDLVAKVKDVREARTVILSDDISRPTPSWAIIPPILNELNKLGVKDDQIEVIIALGTHRGMTREELRAKLGDEVLDRVSVVNHNAWDKENLVYVGKTSSGIPIWLNKAYHNADIKIGVGNIVPHPAAGWSGGSKIVMPGVCGVETIGMVHFHSALYPIEKVFGIRDNPIRREFDEIALKSGLGMIVNTIQNELKEVVDIVAGDVIEAHRHGVKIAEEIYRPKTPLADLAIVSAYPYDIDYWQASKGYLSAYLALRRGGAAVLIAKLPEGISPIPQHRDTLLSLSNLTPNEIRRSVQEGDVEDIVAASVAMTLARAREKIRMYIITDRLSDKECSKLGLVKVRDINEVVTDIGSKLGREPKTVIIKDSSIAPYPLS